MKRAELLLYSPIGENFGGVSADAVAKEVRAMGSPDEINVRINSEGGDVFEGFTIYNLLRRNRATISVDVDGAACSIASVVAHAADKGRLRVAEGSMLMVHNPWSWSMGGAADMRARANLLDKIRDEIVGIYSRRSGVDPEKLSEMMDAETWFSAREAVDAGLADSVHGALRAAAAVNAPWFRNAPPGLSERVSAAMARIRIDARNAPRQ